MDSDGIRKYLSCVTECVNVRVSACIKLKHHVKPSACIIAAYSDLEDTVFIFKIHDAR